MKKTIAVLLVLLMAVTALAGCGGGNGGAGGGEQDGGKASGEAAVKINLGHALSEGTPASDAIVEFADSVAEKTEGRVAIEIFPNSQLGSETEMLEQMQIGSLEAAAIMCGSMQSMDMKMAIEDLPYMWKDISYARKAFDGPFGDYLAGVMEAQGMHKIAYVEWGFRHITNNKKPIVMPEDMKGMKIRVAQTKLRVDAFEQIGALPTIMAFSELYGALQQGVVDAQENPLANIVSANLNEVQKYLSLTGHFYNTIMLMIDNDVWAKIDEKDQQVILEEAKSLSESVRTANDAAEEGYVQELKDRGMEVNDDVNKDAFRKAMLPVYDKWEKEVFGKELMDIYREASGWQ